MLAANQVVAEEYFWMDIPFLYRTHEYPDAEKIQDLARMTAGFGHHIKLSQREIHPREIQKLIEEIEGTKEEAFFEPSDFACDEAGTIYNGKHRTFWSGDSVLLSLYFTNPPLSGFADSSNY